MKVWVVVQEDFGSLAASIIAVCTSLEIAQGIADQHGDAKFGDVIIYQFETDVHEPGGGEWVEGSTYPQTFNSP